MAHHGAACAGQYQRFTIVVNDVALSDEGYKIIYVGLMRRVIFL